MILAGLLASRNRNWPSVPVVLLYDGASALISDLTLISATNQIIGDDCGCGCGCCLIRVRPPRTYIYYVYSMLTFHIFVPPAPPLGGGVNNIILGSNDVIPSSIILSSVFSPFLRTAESTHRITSSVGRKLWLERSKLFEKRPKTCVHI